MAEWKQTNYPGVRYREHATRKNGPQKDRYFSIYYRLDGKRKEEGLGWASAGWNVERANAERSMLKDAHRTGVGPRTLQEKREVAAAERLEAEKNSTTFAQYFAETYFPSTDGAKKENSRRTEKGLFEKWINPVMGNIPLASLKVADVEEVRKKLNKAERAPRTVQYTLAVIRQVWNRAKLDGLVHGDPPTKGVKVPKFDNRRKRFLAECEAECLLQELKAHSSQVYSMALLSLYCGLRAGEVCSLKWGDVDLAEGTLHLKDTKGGVNRVAYMQAHVREHLAQMAPAGGNGYVFVNANGKQVTSVSNTFSRVVDSLGLNDGVENHLNMVVFHTLRHTFASWLVQKGIDLYKVKELMGHSTIAMTERYSHLGSSDLKNAVNVLE